MRIEDYIKEHAIATPGKTAIACGADRLTYADLTKHISDKARDFERGQIVPFRATPSVETLITYFAIHEAGATAVPLDKALPDGPMEELTNRLAKATVPKGIADVMFTTGTTGAPKGAMISHSALLANAENLIEAQGFSSKTNFIVNGPLNHIGSLSKVPPTLVSGGTVHIVDGLRDLGAFFELLEAIETTGGGHIATFLVPANIRMLLTFGRDKLASLADKIEFIETGAAPISQTDMETLCATLPQTRLYNTYASTETGIVCTYNYNAGECIAGCLGKPMRHSSVRITSESTVACSGETLMSGYIGDEAKTQEVMHGGEVFTNDLGTIDEAERLRLTGRQDDVINIGGFKVSPVEVEAAAMEIGWVRECVCVEVEHRVLGKTLKLIVVTDGRELDARAIAKHLKDKLEPHKIPSAYEKADAITRTFNGKVDRKAYRTS